MIGDEDLVPVVILALLEEQVMHSPVVVLHDPKSNRVLPIWIGEPEARAISIAYQGLDVSRPLTHTLLLDVMKALDAEMVSVVIDKIQSNTYFAHIHCRAASGEEFSVDARPSDCLALALMSGVPIYVAGSVMEKSAQKNPFPSEMEQSMSKPLKKSSKKNKAPKVKETFTNQELSQLADLLDKARDREFEEGEGP